jgi:hypothetical protein
VPENIASRPGKSTPVCAELKFHGNTADYSHSKIKQKQAHPEAGVMKVTLLTGFKPERLHNHKENTQTNGKDRPDNMEYSSKGKMQTGEKNMILKNFHVARLPGYWIFLILSIKLYTKPY